MSGWSCLILTPRVLTARAFDGVRLQTRCFSIASTQTSRYVYLAYYDNNERKRRKSSHCRIYFSSYHVRPQLFVKCTLIHSQNFSFDSNKLTSTLYSLRRSHSVILLYCISIYALLCNNRKSRMEKNVGLDALQSHEQYQILHHTLTKYLAQYRSTRGFMLGVASRLLINTINVLNDRVLTERRDRQSCQYW